MSTLNVSNITDGTTTVGTGYVVNGSAKAWIAYNGTGTVAIRDSNNVSSLTDIGAGRQTISFSSAMASSFNYALSATANFGVADIYGGENITTSFGTFVSDYSGAGQDQSHTHFHVQGDLA